MPRLLPSALLLLLAACGPRRDAAGSPEPPPQVLLRGVSLQSFQGDQLVLTGRAERVTYQRSEGAMAATQAVLRRPGPSTPQGPSGETEIRAPVMEGSLASRQLVASGGVVVRTAEGVVARTPQATYDGAERRVRGREGVAAQGPDYALRADSFELSFPDGAFTLEGAVQTVVGGAQ